MAGERKVLIIDSNIMDVLNVEKHLVRSGFAVARLTTPNGVLAKIEYEKPDILVIDITTPRLNVQEVMEWLHQAGRLDEMVVVLLSDLDAATLQAMCLDNEIHGYYCKSMDQSKLGDFLNQFYEDEG